MFKGLTKEFARLGRVAKVKIRKNGPELAIIGGIASMIGGAVLVGKATYRLPNVIEEYENTRSEIEKGQETYGEEKYSTEDKEHDLVLAKVQCGVAIAKLYAPSVAMIAGGAVSVLCGNNMWKKRNATLTASLAAATETFREYRKRVADRYGEEAERKIHYNIQDQKIEETETDPETGKKKDVKKKVETVDGDPSKYSPYARFFDEASREWSKDPDQNFMFLRSQQKLANAKLIADGYLFLNDVYQALDIPETEEGHYVGWVYDPVDGKDNFVDFGIYNVQREAVREFQNGYEPSILLDFNVDGPIVDKIKWGKRG